MLRKINHSRTISLDTHPISRYMPPMPGIIHDKANHHPLAQKVTLTHTYVFGPAMSLLNERERAFVVAWNNGGQRNASMAVRAAGYSQTNGSEHVQAHRLLHNPRIQAAIIEDQKARLIGLDADATNTVKEIMNNPQAPAPSRLKAAEMVYNRGGLGITSVTEHNINVTLTNSEKMGKLHDLASELGIDPKVLLGNIVDLDASEFTEAEEEEEPEITNSIPGLEGLV